VLLFPNTSTTIQIAPVAQTSRNGPDHHTRHVTATQWRHIRNRIGLLFRMNKNSFSVQIPAFP
jgi:hypothetical protein